MKSPSRSTVVTLIKGRVAFLFFVVTDAFFHYAWCGRLCLHPFNLGFRIALSRDSENPNLKAYSAISLRQKQKPCGRFTSPFLDFKAEVLGGAAA